jgi:4-amino-4-deoxy-L-arabinose transferase-like glycosyltransferase
MEYTPTLHPKTVLEINSLPVVSNDNTNYRQKVLWLTLFLSIFRTLFAFTLELGNDEAYYWLYSQDVKWNYFDHPPLVAVLIRIFTGNLLLQDYEGFLRLGSVVSCALSTWFLFKAVSVIHTPRAGWFAAILYNASFYSGLTAGLYIMPDSPQMVFWTLSFWMIAKILSDEKSWKWWIILGIAAGLSIMSKVHAGFIWIGFGLFILFQKRDYLKMPQLYVAVLLSAIIASPILLWNIQHDFVTYRFHSSRVTVDNSVEVRGATREFVGQLIFNNPLNVAMIVAGLLGWRKRALSRFEALSVFNWIGLPLAIVLLFVSFFKDTTLPHWSGPAYISLLPLAAVNLSLMNKHAFFPHRLKWSLGLFIVVLTAWWGIVHFYPGTYGTKNAAIFGRGDISLDTYGWEKASKEFKRVYDEDVQKGAMPENTPLITTYWWGAHIEYYMARPYNIQMLGIGNIIELREYWWMNQQRKKDVDMNYAYCIMPSDESYDLPEQFYNEIELAKVIEVMRNGKPAHYFRVYRLKGLKQNVAHLSLR